MAIEHGDHRSHVWVLTILVHVALDDGDEAGAIEACLELLELSRTSGQLPLGCQALAAAVRIAVRHDRHALAARMEGAIDRHAATVAAGEPTHILAAIGTAVAEARQVLGPEAFDLAHRQGRSRSLSETMRDAEAHLTARGLTHDAAAIDLRGAEAVGPRNAVAALTARERDVLVLLTRGRSNKEIATALGIRPKTVMHQCSVIYVKLDVKNRTQAAAAALQSGVG